MSVNCPATLTNFMNLFFLLHRLLNTKCLATHLEFRWLGRGGTAKFHSFASTLVYSFHAWPPVAQSRVTFQSFYLSDSSTKHSQRIIVYPEATYLLGPLCPSKQYSNITNLKCLYPFFFFLHRVCTLYISYVKQNKKFSLTKKSRLRKKEACRVARLA